MNLSFSKQTPTTKVLVIVLGLALLAFLVFGVITVVLSK
jgi:hypothetical protein